MASPPHPGPANAEMSVGIGAWVMSEGTPRRIALVGLGSCIGLVLADPTAGRIAAAHILLPMAPEGAPAAKAARWADAAVPFLVAQMLSRGSLPRSLQACIIGGAQMMGHLTQAAGSIGDRNAAVCRESLEDRRIPLALCLVGGTTGRTVRIDVQEGQLAVHASGVLEHEMTFRAGGERPSRIALPFARPGLAA